MLSKDGIPAYTNVNTGVSVEWLRAFQLELR